MSYVDSVPQAAREMTMPERLSQVSKGLASRAEDLSVAATRVIALREEYTSAQQHFDQTYAGFNDAQQELRTLLAQAGVGPETAAKGY